MDSMLAPRSEAPALTVRRDQIPAAGVRHGSGKPGQEHAAAPQPAPGRVTTFNSSI